MNIEKVSSELGVGEYRHVVIDVTRTKAPVEGLGRVIERLKKVREAFPESQAVLNVLEPTVALPSKEERKQMAEVMKGLAETTTNIIVFEATGFIAAGSRAALAGIAFLSARPLKVFATVDEAASFLAESLPADERAAFKKGLREQVDAVRASF